MLSGQGKSKRFLSRTSEVGELIRHHKSKLELLQNGRLRRCYSSKSHIGAALSILLYSCNSYDHYTFLFSFMILSPPRQTVGYPQYITFPKSAICPVLLKPRESRFLLSTITKSRRLKNESHIRYSLRTYCTQ